MTNSEDRIPGLVKVQFSSTGRGVRIEKAQVEEGGIEEGVVDASTAGLHRYSTECDMVRADIDARLKIVRGLLWLISSVILLGMLLSFIADMIGRTPSTFSRNLSELQGWLFPTMTLIVGYYFGRQAAIKESMRE